MAYLYQEIMNVPGLTGSWRDRLGEFGRRFYGGSYQGTYDQNIDLLNRIRRGDFGAPKPATKPTPKPVPKPTTPQNQLPRRTPFDEILPFNRVFNPNDIRNLAMSQISPEIERQRTQSYRDQDRNFAESGMFRTGVADMYRNQLNDAFSRQQSEQVSAFINSIKDMATNWYNDQREAYYKNPSAFTMPEIPSFGGNNSNTILNKINMDGRNVGTPIRTQPIRGALRSSGNNTTVQNPMQIQPISNNQGSLSANNFSRGNMANRSIEPIFKLADLYN